MAQKVVVICSITALISIPYRVELYCIRLCRDAKLKIKTCIVQRIVQFKLKTKNTYWRWDEEADGGCTETKR